MSLPLPQHLMTLADLTPGQINQVIGLARRLKAVSRRILPPAGPTTREASWKEAALDPRKLAAPPQSLRNFSIALLFSKRSTRTRVAAETATKLLGGQAIFLGKEDIQLGVNESAKDTVKVLNGMCQGIFARVGDHKEIEELAEHATIPVINALSSLWHPTQVLADLQTLYEEPTLQQEPTPAPNPYSIPYSPKPPDAEDAKQDEPKKLKKVSNSAAARHRVTQAKRRLRPLTIAYVGDSANVLHDMLVTYPRFGHRLRVASPPDSKYRAPTPVWDKVVELECDKSIEWVTDPRDAVKDADIVITDTWISMGQEAEYEQRVKDFQGYQVTEALCEGAKKNWKFLHCLPRKSHEVDDEVFYGPRSLVFREAENRKWTIMALFHIIFGGGSYNALPHGRANPLYQPGPPYQASQVVMTSSEVAYLSAKMNTVLETVKKIENVSTGMGDIQSATETANRNTATTTGSESDQNTEKKKRPREQTARELLGALNKEVEDAKRSRQTSASEEQSAAVEDKNSE